MLIQNLKIKMKLLEQQFEDQANGNGLRQRTLSELVMTPGQFLQDDSTRVGLRRGQSDVADDDTEVCSGIRLPEQKVQDKANQLLHVVSTLQSDVSSAASDELKQVQLKLALKKLLKKLLKHFTSIRKSLPRECRILSSESFMVSPDMEESTQQVTLAIVAPTMSEQQIWETDNRTIVSLCRPIESSELLTSLK